MGKQPTFFIGRVFSLGMIEFVVDEIHNMLDKILPEDIEVVDLQIKGKATGYRTLVRILVDKHNVGITLDECVEINRKLGKELDEKDFFDDRYLLDVSSPGIHYPLETIKDFRRNIGRKLKVNTYEVIGENKEFVGELMDIKDETILLKTENEEIKIPVKGIKKAKQML